MSLGISVDPRRRSKSEEGQKLNVERLQEYKSRLVVFPRKAGKPKAGDATVSTPLCSLCDAIDGKCRVTTLLPTSPVTLSLSPPLTPPRLLVPLPTRRRGPTLSPPSDLLVLLRGTKVRGRRGSLRRRLPRRPSKFGLIRYLEGLVLLPGGCTYDHCILDSLNYAVVVIRYGIRMM